MSSAIVNVTAAPYSAVGDGSTNNTAAFQQAVDDMGALTNGGTVYVPGSSASYVLYTPVWVDGNKVRIVGDGVCSNIAVLTGPAFIMGVLRKPLTGVGGTVVNLPTTAVPRVDSGGSPAMLDSTVSSTTYGLRTTSNEGVALPASLAALGSVASRLVTASSTSTFGVFTLDFIAQNNSNWSQGSSYALLGCLVNDLQNGYIPAPYYVFVNTADHKAHLVFRTTDGNNHDFAISTALSGTGIHRFSVEVDLVNGTVSSYLDGVTQTAGTFTSGLTLVEEGDRAVFKLGSLGENAATFTDFFGVCDITWAGFRMGRAKRFTDSGGNQARLDSGTFTTHNDLYSYFDTTAASLVLYLPGSIAPPNPPDRGVLWKGQNASGFGVFLSKENAYNVNATNKVVLDNLQIQNIGIGAATVAVGQILDYKILNCLINNGYQGVGSIPVAGSYPVLIENTFFQSQKDVAVRGHDWIATLRNCHIDDYGREATRIDSSTTQIVGTYVAGNPSLTARTVFRYPESSSGGVHLIEGVVTDFEGDYPTQCHVYIEAEPNTTGSRLTILNSDFGSAKAGNPIIQAVGHVNNDANTYRPSTIVADGLRMGTPGPTLSDNFNGTNGSISGRTPPTGPTGKTWTIVNGTFQIVSNTVLEATSDNDDDMAVIDSTLSDALISVLSTCIYTSSSNAERAGLIFRSDGTNDKYWLLDFSPQSNLLVLYKHTTATSFVQALSPLTIPNFPSGTQVQLAVQAVGADITCYINGVKMLYINDSFQQSATIHGVRLAKGGTPGGNATWDGFNVYTTNALLSQSGGVQWQVLTSNLLPLS